MAAGRFLSSRANNLVRVDISSEGQMLGVTLSKAQTSSLVSSKAFSLCASEFVSDLSFGVLPSDSELRSGSEPELLSESEPLHE